MQKGDETIESRLELLEEQRKKVREQMAELKKTLDTLDYKCWYYETAKAAGTPAVYQNMSEEEIPQRFREVKNSLQSNEIR